jgi:ribonuclease-3
MKTPATAKLEKKIGHVFADKALLQAALTHRSVAKTTPGARHNQRLEFLGDAVLGLAVAELLYGMYPNEEEGDLSKRFVSLVNGEALAEVARGWKLGDYLIMAAGESEQGGRENPSNLEDGCEALLGAVYLDSGLEPIKAIIDKYFKKLAKANKAPPKDPKTTLQEWAQARGLKLPEYRVVSAQGPAHAPEFVIELHVVGQKPVEARAGNKKLAERLAAEKMLQRLE